jgi:ATP-dependent Clp protease ATP-binding subunit ClpC
LQAAARTGERLGQRLTRSLRAGGTANADLVGLVASRVYVLDRALAGIESGAPREVFLLIRPSGQGAVDGEHGGSFTSMLTEMYVGWADRCGMQVQVLDASSGERLLAVAGLGCGEILRQESGLHVLEHVDEERDGTPVVEREQVVVIVAGRSGSHETNGRSAATDARTTLASVGTPSLVVRRYRAGKSPLVRDGVRGYRTGRLERVLAGEFDLF